MLHSKSKRLQLESSCRQNGIISSRGRQITFVGTRGLPPPLTPGPPTITAITAITAATTALAIATTTHIAIRQKSRPTGWCSRHSFGCACVHVVEGGSGPRTPFGPARSSASPASCSPCGKALLSRAPPGVLREVWSQGTGGWCAQPNECHA